ncbi:hypothetical protein RSJ21_11600 [Clostridium botulinum]|uniref:hypothetical protein n=1 Tax=Clostridium botulinum TaxID=1491 RepID=UPI00094779C9|nr:hypothetical protein [Clostridium botulinum]APQ73921.1 putative cRISPR-associated protein Cas6 [Clostridium botulinum]AUN10811.1 hypothetical protein RSJ6_09950 [Clostridium botulinum]AUN22002.1 hypothetical protein RSJ22_11370 [Clostridium botulinum]AUN25856.1 hypothetical protein RSJ21_11600 [Clostridium botulinum]OSA70939.1 hypothetical protein B2H87_11280 [Clostridium botulinum]
MHYYQLKIRVKLENNINYIQAPYLIGTFINNCMLKNDMLKNIHKKKIYKYVYDSFFPIEKDGIYKREKYYNIQLRTINLNLINKLAIALYNHKFNGIKTVNIDLEVMEPTKINQLYTLKPSIVTITGQPWIKNKHSIDVLIGNLNANLEKKYKQIFNEELENNKSFIKKIKVVNNIPIKYEYKNIILLGNKFEIIVNEDEVSQRKATIALGMGLGEKGSSLGAGFCIYR